MPHLMLVNQVASGFCRLSVWEGKHPVPVHKLAAQVAVCARDCAGSQHLDGNCQSVHACVCQCKQLRHFCRSWGTNDDEVCQC